MRTYITQKGYNCKEGLVEQLYLNLKAKPFTLILGTSRVDMTVLPRLFAESQGATEENGRYLQLRVRPDWMDSSDLFGWLNLEGRFIPGAIIDFLKAAQNDPENPYFLCLDRIILSRAEYYLRDFLTAVELRGEPDRKPYVPQIYYGRDEQALQKYGVIPVLSNLFVVGTVNLDETSLPLNQRFLDRVHTMSLEEGDMTPCMPGDPVPVKYDLSTICYRLDQWEEEGVIDAYIREFEEVNKILMQATSYLGFQIRNEGILYLLHNRVTGMLPEQAAMDQVICQKVLPRIQGAAKLVRPVLEQMHAYCAARGYTITEAKVQKMLRQCEKAGYCSCWETE